MYMCVCVCACVKYVCLCVRVKNVSMCVCLFEAVVHVVKNMCVRDAQHRTTSRREEIFVCVCICTHTRNAIRRATVELD